MKKIALCFSLLCFFAFTRAQTVETDILGKWLSESGKAKIEIFQSGKLFYGKIIWLKNPNDEHGQPKTDFRNPDPSKRNHKLMGLLLVKGLEFDGQKEWHKGSIYDPENGKEYKCKITKDAKGNLDIRGYIGVSMIGRTTVWSRAE